MYIIDPGHGGKDPGAVRRYKVQGVACEFMEKDIALAVSSRLINKVVDNIEFDTTRLFDEFKTLEYRCQLANSYVTRKAFISIHCNSCISTKPYGTEIWVYKNSPKSIELAESIGSELIKIVPKWRGIKHAYIEPKNDPKAIYVLKYTKMPAVLVELDFISNKESALLMMMPDYQQRLAEAIMRGTENWL